MDAGSDAARPRDAGPPDSARSEYLGFPDTRAPDAAPAIPDLPLPQPDAPPFKPDAPSLKPDAAVAKPLQIYLSPKGSDKSSGTSPGKPILTLARAQQVIAALKPQTDVEVRIAPGTYHGQKVAWTYTMPGHKIHFMTLKGDKTRPVFDGCLEQNPKDLKKGCPGGTWFTLKHAKGQKTNLHFYYIRVQRYQTAISLNGDRNSPKTSNGNNRVYGCYFYKIGNVFNNALKPSTAAVRLVNSTYNYIGNNHFINIINSKSAGLLHALYIAHLSSHNQIIGNKFSANAGDPVRLRDFSNYNQIRKNNFIKSGIAAGYTDWYCNHDIYTNCTKKGPECPSWENQFRDNTLNGNYACQPLAAFKYFQGDTAKGCAPPAKGAKRLYTSGNVKPKPCS